MDGAPIAFFRGFSAHVVGVHPVPFYGDAASNLTMISPRYRPLGLFVLSYLLLYLLYALVDFLPNWDAYGPSFFRGTPILGYAFIDPLFLGISLVGFSMMWIAIRWYASTFHDDQILSVPFALGFVVLSYGAFFLADLLYYWNNAFLVAMAQGNPSPLWSSFGAATDFVAQNFLDHILQSPFFVFILAALLGWFSYYLIHRVFSHAAPAHHSA